MISLKSIIPVTKAKRELMKMLKKAQLEGESYIITKDGEAAGVLMGADEYDGLIETIRILQNQSTVSLINQAQRQFDEGTTYTHKQVFEE